MNCFQQRKIKPSVDLDKLDTAKPLDRNTLTPSPFSTTKFKSRAYREKHSLVVFKTSKRFNRKSELVQNIGACIPLYLYVMLNFRTKGLINARMKNLLYVMLDDLKDTVSYPLNVTGLASF